MRKHGTPLVATAPSINLMCLRTIKMLTLSSKNNLQGDHLSGKPGNVEEFDSCQGNVRDFTKCQGENLVREKWPKTVCCKLHICIHTGI